MADEDATLRLRELALPSLLSAFEVLLRLGFMSTEIVKVKGGDWGGGGGGGQRFFLTCSDVAGAPD